jgi:hypothetical protein
MLFQADQVLRPRPPRLRRWRLVKAVRGAALSGGQQGKDLADRPLKVERLH